MSQELEQDLRAVREARVYFNHMSVGNNILTGLEKLSTAGDPLDIRKIDEPTANLSESFFAHSMLGKNGDPESKMRGFESFVESGVRPDPQVALMKLCYIDIKRGTDVKTLFESYRSMIGRLEQKHPDIAFGYITAPLTVKDEGWKGALKALTGFKDDNAHANIERERFNRLLRDSFPADSIFDLAEVESHWPDGRRETFERDGRTYPSLVPAYASDRGHLNALGQERAARGLVRTLASLIRKRSGK